MPPLLRRAFPYIAIGLLLAALAWATSFSTLPQADFTFHNGNEVETIDPALATGQPENRVINALFEGLLRNAPPDNWEKLVAPGKNVPLSPGPGLAERWEISDDGCTYTFHMRKGAKWSNGEAVTAADFAWSWMRMLHPETPSKYAYQLYYLVGAREYNLAQVEPGGLVEVELADRKNPNQLFPRGSIVRGVLKSIHKPPAPPLADDAPAKQKTDAEIAWKKQWVYAVTLNDGQQRRFAKNSQAVNAQALIPAIAQGEKGKETPIEQCLQVLPDFESTVGVKAETAERLVVRLNQRTPYFADLVAFYPLYALNRRCIEEHGSPAWAKPEHIVGSGAFRLKFRRIRDRIRLEKSPTYWDRESVGLQTIDALAVKSETTALNMYLDGQVDWIPSYLPLATIPTLAQDYADQFYRAPFLTTYFYRVNVTRPELTDKRVRKALNLAIDKRAICEHVIRGGELPAATYVPPGLAGYASPAGLSFEVSQARKLLAEAGYPGGRGLPTIEILYNDLDMHRTIAETIQQMWRENLGIDVELRGLEWGVYLDSTHRLDYDVSRGGWIADYPDPNTFLDMFMTGNENNQTGWGNAQFDELIRRAAAEPDAARRMAIFAEAETLLLDESPIIPIYFYVTKNLIKTRIQGFFSTVQDEHPLKMLRIAK